MMSDTSTWQSDIEIKQRFQSLKKTLTCDVLVIGAGITGITTAYVLSKKGLRVALIEKGIIHQNSATAFTTAFITQAVDTDLTALSDGFGQKTAKLIWQSGGDAIDFIEKIVKKEKIDCEFVRCSDYEYATYEDEVDGIKEEAEYAKKLGFDVEFHEQNDLNLPYFSYMEIKNQAKFHPLKYLNKLIDVSVKNGVKFFENTEALKVVEEDGIVWVDTKDAMIAANNVVMATYSPFNHPIQMYFKGGLYITYVMEVEIPHGFLKEGMYEDSNLPYHYFRVDPGRKFDRLIIGGEDHREDLPVSEEKSFKALEKYLKQLMRGEKYKIKKRWTGPILEPVDGIAYIGKYRKESNILATHGFSGTGMTYGTTAAMIFSDTILKKKNKYAEIFEASRNPTLKRLLIKGIDYSEEMIGGAIRNTLGMF